MESQNSTINMDLGSGLLNLYSSIINLQKSLLASESKGPQIKLNKLNQSFTPYRHHTILQPKINPLQTYTRSVHQLVPIDNLQSILPLKLSAEKLPLQLEVNNRASVEKHESCKDGLKDSVKKTPFKVKKREDSAIVEKKEQISPNQDLNNSRKKKSYWLPQEDEQLLELMKIHGEKWTKIASCLEGRTGKQARDRYINYLNPSIRQKVWTEEEEQALDRLYQEFGNKWSKIAASLPGRTENQVKNKFYSGVRQGKYEMKKGALSEEDYRERSESMQLEKRTSETLTVKTEDEQSSNNLLVIKNEVFENCNLLSQAVQAQIEQNSKTIEEQSNMKENLLNLKDIVKASSPLRESEEMLCNPYKKVKCDVKQENLEDEAIMDIKQKA